MKTILSVDKFSTQCRSNLAQYLSRAGYKVELKHKDWISGENFKLEWILEIDWS